MRRRHFHAFAPICPVCAGAKRGEHPLRLAGIHGQVDDDVRAGILHCSEPSCQHEYPIIDGIPLIVPDLRRLLAERGVELLLREDLDADLESLIGDALGPDSWFDAARQVVSTYGWDGYADLDPVEAAPRPAGPVPGGARRCLDRLLALAAPEQVTRVLDLGCAAGRTSFELAARYPDGLVLGVDIHLGLLRLAQHAAAGRVAYSRRRIGIVYDQRRFPVRLAGAERVDFWACDALALPFAAATADLAAALNLLDCVADPPRLLAGLAAVVRTGGRILLATPYDWSPRATPLETWIGGHSQRGEYAGGGEAFLRTLLGGPHLRAARGLTLLAEEPDFPWQTRLHERSAVAYRTHLLALARGVG